MSLIYRPFLIEDKTNPQPLELAEADSEDKAPEIIEEREGIPYINKEALNPGPETEEALDRELKTLIDSVIK
jgi:hypothetical protein